MIRRAVLFGGGLSALLVLAAAPAGAEDRSPARRSPQDLRSDTAAFLKEAGAETWGLLAETWIEPPSPEAVRRVVEAAMAAVARAAAESDRRVAEAEAARRACAARLAALEAEKKSLEERLTDALARAAELEAGAAPDAAALRAEIVRLQTALAEAEAAAVETAPGRAALATTAPRRLDLNLASREALAVIDAIGPERAGAIVWYRERIARFRSVTDLIRVPGFDRSRVESVRPYLEVGPLPADNTREDNDAPTSQEEGGNE